MSRLYEDKEMQKSELLRNLDKFKNDGQKLLNIWKNIEEEVQEEMFEVVQANIYIGRNIWYNTDKEVMGIWNNTSAIYMGTPFLVNGNCMIFHSYESNNGEKKKL